MDKRPRIFKLVKNFVNYLYEYDCSGVKYKESVDSESDEDEVKLYVTGEDVIELTDWSLILTCTCFFLLLFVIKFYLGK